MDELIAFVTARLDEEEAAAKAAMPGPWHADRAAIGGIGGALVVDNAVNETIALIPSGGDRASGEYLQRARNMAHIARHDPARVLREVAAKRAIVRRCAGVMNEMDQYPNDLVSPRALLARQTLIEIAAVWSDHPDYPSSGGSHAL